MSHKILVIEDEEALRDAIVITLEKAGFEVITASNGDKGLSMAKNDKPDFLILDLLLPKKNGLDVLAEIRKDKEIKNLPVLVLTAYDDGTSISKCVELGIVSYFVKSDHSLNEIVKIIKNN